MADLEGRQDLQQGNPVLTYSAPMVPDLSSEDPRPQISLPSYSPPKGSCVHMCLVAGRTGTTSSSSVSIASATADLP
jgi:hypothetical protein